MSILHQSKKSKNNENLDNSILGFTRPSKAAKIVGSSWVAMFFMAIPIVLLVLEKLVVKGDTANSLENISGNENLLYAGIAGYFLILVLDATIGVGLYYIFRHTQQKIAVIMAIFRLIFVSITALSLIALAKLHIEMYSNGVLIGYLFLIPHLFLIGYLSIKSWYIPKPLAIVMIVASFSYIITIFGVYILPSNILSIVYPIAMIPASLAEVSYGIYFILRNNQIEEKIDWK